MTNEQISSLTCLRTLFDWPSFLLFAGARHEHIIVSPLLHTKRTLFKPTPTNVHDREDWTLLAPCDL